MNEIFYLLILVSLFVSWTRLNFAKDEEATVSWHNTSLSSYFLHRAAEHPIFEQIAKGTLNELNFLGFIQQDDVFVTNLFDSIEILLDRIPLSDNYTRSELKDLLNGRENYSQFFKDIYGNSSYDISTPRQVYPVTLGYMAFERNAVLYDDIEVALMSFFACFTVYFQMAIIINPIANLKNNPDHRYYSYIKPLIDSTVDNSGLKKFEALVTHHYNNPTAPTEQGVSAVRKKMIETYLQGLDWEWNFAENGLTTAAETRISPVLTFTDLVESKVVHYFWEQLNKVTLSNVSCEGSVLQDLTVIESSSAQGARSRTVLSS